jgi:hypothetical protein
MKKRDQPFVGLIPLPICGARLYFPRFCGKVNGKQAAEAVLPSKKIA